MTELGPILERLGLDQYLDAFLCEGFDTWETVLDIQESDLDALNVKRGHRRKLQREIADFRGIPYERLVAGSPALDGSSDAGTSAEGGRHAALTTEKPAAGGAESKRKYRRHPKSDENAPKRPASAYMLFTKMVRDEVKGEGLSFPAIAKLVGHRWQSLDAAQKEPFEAEAMAAKERFNGQLSIYKETEAYRQYTQYLGEFKAKHGVGSGDHKKPKLEKEPSSGSIAATSPDASEHVVPYPAHRRVGSMSSASSASFHPPPSSPGSASFGYGMATPGVIFGAATARRTAPSPQTESPTSTPLSYLPRSTMSSQSSISEDTLVGRGEQLNPLPQTGHLSLLPSPHVLPSGASVTSFDSHAGPEHLTRSSRFAYASPQQPSSSRMSPDSYPYRPAVPTAYGYQPATTGVDWRARPTESPSQPLPHLTRTLQPPMAMPRRETSGALPLPSPQGPDLSQRTLPLPPLLSRRDNEHDASGLSRAAPSAGFTGHPQPGHVPVLGRSESEAVHTLAGLSSEAGPGKARGRPGERQHGP